MKMWSLKSCCKLEMIEDYIELNKIIMICEVCKSCLLYKGCFSKLEQIYNEAINLKESYNRAFLKFGMLDISWGELELELKRMRNEYNKISYFDERLLNEILEKLSYLKLQLGENLKKFRVNEFEQNFILRDM